MIDRVDDETLLDRFRQWLQEARAEAEALDHPPGSEPREPEAEVREVGIFQLVEEFTALRHELKLQTRSARGLQEQSESLLGAMQQAIDQFRSVEPKEAQAAWSAGKPLAEALADLDEALDRGRVEMEKVTPRLIEEPVQAVQSAFDALYARSSWFRRRLLKSYHEQVKEIVRDKGQVRRELVDALLEGYGLIQARLRRALKSERIHAIECLNRPVDPELMTVVEVVEDPDRPPGVVVEQIRRGYTWQGRLLRYAEVRASRAPTLSADP
ncbi:nucleotide exchange factor GrpE [Singulisphaera acidiphila]|uniref:Molecular chaperone GrpE (Heat shock protein) n=1 Tax=Singulisphaera acidiphila (strain ATCC BAA-1392 / DSM 18658 / VKM B-2454 / MOB10) TaxID=886293 RepID=L0D6Y0_SINAD|nr:nucleotide exchange factor GrpE [Singulisphaera acidiphila]AGA24593.1 molecular chaperone GrpE (heat shock protein) [Singulisphaera acidiphila DSM 18658]